MPLSTQPSIFLIALTWLALALAAAPVAAEPAAAEQCSPTTSMTRVDIPAETPGRIALLMTNQDYGKDIGPLEATHKDGETLCRALVALGFAVLHVRDVDRATFLSEMQAFVRRISRLDDLPPDPNLGKASFFYYSGHGMEDGGTNYLIPIKSTIHRRTDLGSEAVNLDLFIKDVHYAARATGVPHNFLVIDACRNTAIAAGLRGGNRGFVPVSEESGLMIAFSTAPGTTADDANNYSGALAEEMQTSNQDAFVTFREVRRRVLDKTNNRQFPWTHDGLLSAFYFRPDKSAPITVGTPLKRDEGSIENGKRVFEDCADCPRMRLIIPRPQETPLAPYMLGMYEVTFSEWRRCVDEGGCGRRMPSDSGFGHGRHPVINVSRAEIQLYLDWLNAQTSGRYTFRLPTEAEWDYAARGDRQSRYVYDDDPQKLCEHAHGDLGLLGPNKACMADNHQARGTNEVGRLRPNPFGLYDMAGNVWEFVDTCFETGGARSGCDLVLRGGSWRSGPDELEITARRRAPMGYASRITGFRVARDTH